MRRSEWMWQRRTLEWILVVLLVIHCMRISLGATIPAPVAINYSIYDTVLSSDQQNLNSQMFRESHDVALLSRSHRSVTDRRRRRRPDGATLERNQRSANLSYTTGSARKIQLYIKHHFLQILPDGVVNGTQNVYSDYTILQRTTVDVGKIKIQGVATCLYLCMDMCGGIYASRKFNQDCVFNESMQENHYNVYSSSYHSNAKRMLYLGMTGQGHYRLINISTSRTLGQLSDYALALTHIVDPKSVDDLVARVFGANHVRHGLKQLCDSGKAFVPMDKSMGLRPKCNPDKVRKKKCPKGGPECRRKCRGKKCNQGVKGAKGTKGFAGKKRIKPPDHHHVTTTESEDTATDVFDDDS
ncbi:hypothetical protein DMENIID0001_115850 [Sergentomyia squamirostris]